MRVSICDRCWTFLKIHQLLPGGALSDANAVGDLHLLLKKYHGLTRSLRTGEIWLTRPVHICSYLKRVHVYVKEKGHNAVANRCLMSLVSMHEVDTKQTLARFPLKQADLPLRVVLSGSFTTKEKVALTLPFTLRRAYVRAVATEFRKHNPAFRTLMGTDITKLSDDDWEIYLDTACAP
jgi:hypothetical protein